MVKRTSREIRKVILEALSDGLPHAHGSLERRVNTNWQTVRNHCEDLQLFGAITISEKNRIKITKKGLNLLKRM